MPRTRKIILMISSLVTWILYGVKLSDPHNGYRVIRISALKKITLQADGMHYANEFNEQIGTYKLSFVEVPVYIRYTEYSLSKGQKNSNSIKLGFEMLYKKPEVHIQVFHIFLRSNFSVIKYQVPLLILRW